MISALRQVSSPLMLRPAYGKTYETAADMLAGWNAGDTFRIFGGPYCSIRDIVALRNDSSSIQLTNMHNQFVNLE